MTFVNKKKVFIKFVDEEIRKIYIFIYLTAIQIKISNLN